MYIYKNNYDANWPENVERIDTLKLCTVQKNFFIWLQYMQHTGKATFYFTASSDRLDALK